MTPDKIFWLLVVPFVKPAPGGCATYVDTLVRGLAGAGDDVLVVSEQHPDAPRSEKLDTGPGSATVLRKFPYRAGRAKKDLWSYVAYARSNFDYLGLPGLLRREFVQSDAGRVVMLLHSSLLYNASVLPWILSQFRNIDGTHVEMVVDVRDMQFPDIRLPNIREFSQVVTSSIGVAEDLIARGADRAKIVQIPMPFIMPTRPDDRTIAATLDCFGLAGRRYLLNPNGISRSKGYGQMREATRALRTNPVFEDIVLVTVGRDRDRTAADDLAEKEGLAIFLGPVSREHLLALMCPALFTLILSPQEAISRGALEAMAVGGQVILPDVAEFRIECETHIWKQTGSEDLSCMITRLADAEMPRFDFGRHQPSKYIPAYRALGRDSFD